MKRLLTFLSMGLLTISLASAQEQVSGADDDKTILSFSSQGDPKNVIFLTTTGPAPCEGLSRAAGVYDAAILKEKLLPFIAKFEEKTHALFHIFPTAEVKIKGGVPLQVMSSSTWSDQRGNMTVGGQCGPFTQQFTPVTGHRYHALFTFSGNGCAQSIQDNTDESAVVDVQTTPLACEKPSIFK